MKHFKLLLAILTFFIVPITSYFIIKHKNTKKIEWYSVSTPVTQDLKQFITATGRLKALDQITIGSLVTGRVIKLYVEDNDFVKKDQILVELDDGIGYSAVKKSKAALQQAKVSLKYLTNFYSRQKILFEAGQLAKDAFESITKDYETAKAQVSLAESELEISQKTYDNLFIKAPESGVIISKQVDLGQMVTSQLEATELFIIAKDLTKMEAEIDVDEADIGVVRIGQEAIFTVDAFSQKDFQAKIKQINYAYTVVDNVITYAVLLNVDNPDLLLRPGMTTNVDIRITDVKGALCVPNKALRVTATDIKEIAKTEHMTFESLPESVETRKKETLWVLENNKNFKQIFVKTGVTDGHFTQILDGISPATIVVLEALNPNRENPIKLMGKMKA